MVQGIKPGESLDIGIGQGRNSVYLAKHGWDVTGFDVSDEGVAAARLNAQRAGVRVNAVVANAYDFDWGENRWDLIVATYEDEMGFAASIVKALALRRPRRDRGLPVRSGAENGSQAVHCRGTE